MAKKEENPLFVGITSGNDLRKSMLECSKSILESLKEHEKFKSIREEKMRLVNEFKGEIKGISRLINALRMSLPKVKEAEIKKPEVKRAEAEKQKMVNTEKLREKTELEKLEEELSEIESKLDSLS